MSTCGFVAVHVGAGHHAFSKTDQYKRLCKNACLEAVAKLKDGALPHEAAVDAVVILEDSPLTNAGIGSCLTENKQVQCDACVAEGTTRFFGAVGAVPGVQNPIVLARELLVRQLGSELSCGRIPPAFLVGSDALQWAKTNKVLCIARDDMTTSAVLKLYDSCRLKLAQPPPTQHRRLEDVCNVTYGDVSQYGGARNHHLFEEVMDTVGAVCVDVDGKTAAAVSSGGIMMKQAGRVGQAAMLGSGCWAEDYASRGNAVAVATTGCGETLVRTLLAKECADVLRRSDLPATDLQRVLTEAVLKSPCFVRPPERLAGALMLSYNAEAKHGDVMWTHTTDSMCLAYMSTSDRKAKSQMSRLPNEVTAGQSLVVGGSPFHLCQKV